MNDNHIKTDEEFIYKIVEESTVFHVYDFIANSYTC